jgi:hypothetical protein
MASYTKEHHQNLNIERVASRSLPDTVRGYYAFKLLIWRVAQTTFRAQLSIQSETYRS